MTCYSQFQIMNNVLVQNHPANGIFFEVFILAYQLTYYRS